MEGTYKGIEGDPVHVELNILVRDELVHPSYLKDREDSDETRNDEIRN